MTNNTKSLLNGLAAAMHMTQSEGNKEWQAIESYITGKQADLPQIPVPQIFMYYNFIDIIAENLDNDDAKRMYFLLCAWYPLTMQAKNHFRKNCFREYQICGISEDIVEGTLWNYMRHMDLLQLEIMQRSMAGDRKQLVSFASIFPIYPLLVHKLVFDETPTALSLVLAALGAIWYENQEQEYLCRTEELTYAWLKNLFLTAKGWGDRPDYLMTEQAISLYDKVTPFDISHRLDHNKDVSDLIKMTVAICYLLHEKSDIMRCALRMCLHDMQPNYVYQILRAELSAPQDVYSFYKRIHMPADDCMSMAAFDLLFTDSRAHFLEIQDYFAECYAQDKNAVYEFYNKRSKNHWLECLPVAAFLTKQDADFPNRTDLEMQLILLIKERKCLRNQKDENFLQLKQPDIDLQGWQIADSQIMQLTKAMMCLHPYSTVAKNFTIIAMRERFSSFRSTEKLEYYISSLLCAEPECTAPESKLITWFEEIADKTGLEILFDICPFDNPDITAFLTFAKAHLTELEQRFISICSTQDDLVSIYISTYFEHDIGLSLTPVVDLLGHRKKTIIEYAENFLKTREAEVRPIVEALQKGKNASAKEAAARLIKLWDADKIQQQMESITDAAELTEFLQDRFGKPRVKKIPFLEQVPLDNVLLQYYFSEYMLLKQPQRIAVCDKIRTILGDAQINPIAQEFYNVWLKNAAEAKYKNILLPYAVSATAGQVTELKRQIDTWTDSSRGALAAFAVSALSLNDNDITLLIIDGISKKYKNKQVRSAADNAMQQAAENLGLTKEQLGDRIVPNLGFSKQREQIFDFGTRQFKAVLGQDLAVGIYDESGKKMKNLPKPSAKDDAAKAEAASAHMKDLKKQLKTVVKNQKDRLENAVITGRRWTREAWEKLFIENPVMNGFAIGLIWEELDQQNTLVGTFRYMEDGTFNSPEEEEYTLQENSKIVLLNPIDISEELRETWKQQLEDYEIIQPITQLEMPVYHLPENQKDAQNIDIFNGKKVYFGTIRGAMDKYGWQRTSIVDGGGYDGYYYEDADSHIGMQLRFDFLYVGIAADEVVTMETMEFYKAKTIQYGSYIYDEINQQNRIEPAQVPEKLLSFALMVGNTIAEKEVQ